MWTSKTRTGKTRTSKTQTRSTITVQRLDVFLYKHRSHTRLYTYSILRPTKYILFSRRYIVAFRHARCLSRSCHPKYAIVFLERVNFLLVTISTALFSSYNYRLERSSLFQRMILNKRNRNF